MPARPTASQITDDQLDALHEQIGAAEDLAEQHARNTLTVARERETYRQAWKEAQRMRAKAEARIARVRKLAEFTRDRTAAGESDWAIGQHELALAVLDTLGEPTPAHDAGPSVAECAADDDRWWNSEKAGEGQ